MTQPYLGEVKIVGFNFPPKGWALCNGQILAIQQNQALFSILGTTYGGNGVTTFGLPNLQGRTPLHVGNGIALGEAAGETTHTLTSSEMPQHTHQLNGTASAGAAPIPVGNLLAAPTKALYHASDSGAATMSASTVGNAGGNQPHDNMMPYLVLNFCIALTGVFPSRN